MALDGVEDTAALRVISEMLRGPTGIAGQKRQTNGYIAMTLIKARKKNLPVDPEV